MRIKIFKWNTLCIYIVCAFLSGNAGGQTPPDDHGSSFGTATPIRLGDSISGELSIGDRDYFRIDIATPVDVRIFTEGTIDTTGRLYGLYDGWFTSLAFDHNSGNDDNFLIRGPLYVDTYYIVVRGFRGLSVGAYTLTVQTDTSVVTDIHSDTTATATPISLDAIRISGELHSGDVDYFRIEVASQVYVRIFTEGTIDTTGRLYDGSLTLLAFNDNLEIPLLGIFRQFSDSRASRSRNILYCGTWFFCIFSRSIYAYNSNGKLQPFYLSGF